MATEITKLEYDVRAGCPSVPVNILTAAHTKIAQNHSSKCAQILNSNHAHTHAT